MYGLVNRAVRDLVVSKFGDDAWSRITESAGLSVDTFVSMEHYDDAITYRLVGAASEVLELEPAAILEAFGEYWTTYTIEEGYGQLLEMMGSTLEEFLDNLDSMHARIGEGMPELLPPSFERIEQPDGSSILIYESEREGLQPMVVGLLRGLGQRFGETLEIESLGTDEHGATRFHVRRDASAERAA